MIDFGSEKFRNGVFRTKIYYSRLYINGPLNKLNMFTVNFNKLKDKDANVNIVWITEHRL